MEQKYQFKLLSALVLFVSASLSSLQILKEPSYDLQNYLRWFNSAAQSDLLFVLNERVFFDPLFYVPTALIGIASGGHDWVFISFWSFIIYWLILQSFLIYCSKHQLAFATTLFLVTFVALIGISFGLVTHLVRQNVAIALFVFGMAMQYKNASWSKWFYIAAGFVHYQFLLIVGIFYITLSILMWNNYKLSNRVALSTLIVLFFCASVSPYATDAAMQISISICNFLPDYGMAQALCDRTRAYREVLEKAGFVSFRTKSEVFFMLVAALFFYIIRSSKHSERELFSAVFAFTCLMALFSFNAMVSERLLIGLRTILLCALPLIFNAKNVGIAILFASLLGATSIMRFIRMSFHAF